MYAGGLSGLGQRYMSLAGNMSGMGSGGYSPGGLPRDGGGGQLEAMGGGGQGKDMPTRAGGIPMGGGNGELSAGQSYNQNGGGLVNSSAGGGGIPTSQSSFNDAYNFASSNMEPRLARAQEAQYTRLRNQGLDPTSEAFKSSTNDLALQQNESRNNLAATVQQQMFNQGLQGRQQQMNELNPGMQFANQALSPSYANVPGVNVGNVDIAGLSIANQQQQQQNYQQQMAQRNAMMGGLAGLGGSMLMAPLTGGTSLGGMIGSGIAGGFGNIFGGGGNASPLMYGRAGGGVG
jgi:hypothetical protein